MNEIRVGVIGVGYLGKFHAEKYAAMDNVRLVGVADIDRSRAEDIAARLGSQSFTDYRDLLRRVDAVSIVVPTESHFKIGLEFLNHDTDVLIEKPMTTTLEQADELIDVAESRGRILQIGHLERFNPAVLALKDIITHPMFIEAHRLSIFKDRSTDVSVVLDLMIHDIDIILNIVNSEIKSIHAAGAPVICEHADIANVRLQFESGCVAVYEAAAAGLPLLLPALPWAQTGYPEAEDLTFLRLGGVQQTAHVLAEFHARSQRRAEMTFPVSSWADVARQYLDVYAEAARP